MRPTGDVSEVLDSFDYVVVLMPENRSYDNLPVSPVPLPTDYHQPFPEVLFTASGTFGDAGPPNPEMDPGSPRADARAQAA